MSRYQGRHLLGEGAAGRVFRATDVTLDRPVALKVLKSGSLADTTARKRFIREAQVTASLSHPNLVTLYDAGEDGGELYLVMELVEGDSLAGLMERGGVPRERLLRIVEKIARGVHHAHERGAVHRDLKPANVLIAKNGEPKVTDFGLTHLMHGDSLITRSGQALGTPVYMAPEQAQGDNQRISARTDVYSLGAIAYEICTGRAPFEGRTVVEIYRRIVNQPPIAPSRLEPSVAPDLETIVLKAIEKNPIHRYATALEFADDLKRFLAGEPIRARRIGGGRRAFSAVTSSRGAMALAGVIVAAIVASIILIPRLLDPSAPKPAAPRPAAAAAVDPWPALTPKLIPAIRDLEDAFHGRKTGVDPAARRAEIERLTETTKDPVARAWRGLAVFLSGGGDADLDAPPTRDARAAFLYAFARWSACARLLHLPPVQMGSMGVVCGQFVEGDEMMRARTALGTVLRGAPDAPELRAIIACHEAVALLYARKFEESRRKFESAMDDEWIGPGAAMGAGLSQFALGQAAESAKTWRRGAARRWPYFGLNEGTAWLAMGTWNCVRGDADPVIAFTKATEVIDEAIRLNPDSPDAHNEQAYAFQRVAEILAQTNRPAADAMARAIAECAEVLRLKPGLASANMTRAQVLFLRSDIDAAQGRDPLEALGLALADLDAGVRAMPGEPLCYMKRAEVHRRIAARKVAKVTRDHEPHFQKATEDLTKAIELNRALYEPVAKRAQVYYELSRLGGPRKMAFVDAALRDFEETLRLNPAQADCWVNRANLFGVLGDFEMNNGKNALATFEKGLTAYSRAIELVDDWGARLGRGNIRYRLGDLERDTARKEAQYLEGLKDFDVVIRARPEQWMAMLFKGAILERLGRADEAAAVYAEGVQAYAANPDAASTFRQSLKAMGR